MESVTRTLERNSNNHYTIIQGVLLAQGLEPHGPRFAGWVQRGIFAVEIHLVALAFQRLHKLLPRQRFDQCTIHILPNRRMPGQLTIFSVSHSA